VNKTRTDRQRASSCPFVADGWRRLSFDPAHQEKQRLLEAKIREKYSAELSAAPGFWRRMLIMAKIRRELRRSRPSPHCLWLTS